MVVGVCVVGQNVFFRGADILYEAKMVKRLK